MCQSMLGPRFCHGSVKVNVEKVIEVPVTRNTSSLLHRIQNSRNGIYIWNYRRQHRPFSCRGLRKKWETRDSPKIHFSFSWVKSIFCMSTIMQNLWCKGKWRWTVYFSSELSTEMSQVLMIRKQKNIYTFWKMTSFLNNDKAQDFHSECFMKWFISSSSYQRHKRVLWEIISLNSNHGSICLIEEQGYWQHFFI